MISLCIKLNNYNNNDTGTCSIALCMFWFNEHICKGKRNRHRPFFRNLIALINRMDNGHWTLDISFPNWSGDFVYFHLLVLLLLLLLPLIFFNYSFIFVRFHTLRNRPYYYYQMQNIILPDRMWLNFQPTTYFTRTTNNTRTLIQL